MNRDDAVTAVAEALRAPNARGGISGYWHPLLDDAANMIDALAAETEALRREVERLTSQHDKRRDDMIAALAERNEDRAALARVEALHQPRDGKDFVTLEPVVYCTSREHPIATPWPCATRRAITGEAP